MKMGSPQNYFRSIKKDFNVITLTQSGEGGSRSIFTNNLYMPINSYLEFSSCYSGIIQYIISYFISAVDNLKPLRIISTNMINYFLYKIN